MPFHSTTAITAITHASDALNPKLTLDIVKKKRERFVRDPQTDVTTFPCFSALIASIHAVCNAALRVSASPSTAALGLNNDRKYLERGRRPKISRQRRLDKQTTVSDNQVRGWSSKATSRTGTGITWLKSIVFWLEFSVWTEYCCFAATAGHTPTGRSSETC